MTREHAKNILPIIQAYAEGKEIQYYHKGAQKWLSNDGCGFSSGYEYRIKPEPREWWIGEQKQYNGPWVQCSDTKSYSTPIKVREVIE